MQVLPCCLWGGVPKLVHPGGRGGYLTWSFSRGYPTWAIQMGVPLLVHREGVPNVSWECHMGLRNALWDYWLCPPLGGVLCDLSHNALDVTSILHTPTDESGLMQLLIYHCPNASWERHMGPPRVGQKN